MPRLLILIASLFGVTAVAMGAFAAHGLKQVLAAQSLGVLETAVQYQMFHALAILGVAVLALHQPHKALNVTGVLFSLGVVLFSGSLYLLTLTSIKGLGLVTPIGGVLLMAGWLALMSWALRVRAR